MATTKKADAGDKTTKARGGAAKTVQPSPELAAVIGSEPLPRTQVVSKLWDYIREHKLQDDKDRRQINADAKLEKVFGQKSVDMFKMTKLVSDHLK